MTPEELHRLLLDPAAYPMPPKHLELRETHISRLCLTDDFVYKLKKPVNFGFLDFTTLSRRRHFCQEELRLNRRFAPDTYLKVVPVRLNGNRLQIDGKVGAIVDYAVVMRRLPRQRMLDYLIEQDDPSLPAEAARLGRALGAIHGDAPRARGGAAWATLLRRNWEENFAQCAPFAGITITPQALEICRARIRAELDALTPLLRSRETSGLVRDGHGDLHAEHICLTEPLRIYDCIEFNRRFRIGDILEDLAFLLMDLDKRGRRDLAALVQAEWCRALESDAPPRLLRLYKLYRAFIRGKVESLLAADLAAPAEERHAAAARAAAYFNLALGYLAPPALLLTCGLMGVGKSVLGRALAQALGAVQLRSDLLRKELAGLDPLSRRDDRFGSGLYQPEMTRRTYDALLAAALSQLSTGAAVIVDASFSDPGERERFRCAAATAGVPCLLLHLHCPQAVALQRLAERQSRGADPSDGRVGLYRHQEQTFIPPAPAEAALAIDTTAAISSNVQTILVALLTRS